MTPVASSPTPRRRSRSAPFLALLAVTSFACLDYRVRYTAADDEAAMGLITSTWDEGGGGLVLSLCEDVARSDAWEGPDCSADHVVKGGGRTVAHTETHPYLGCGGCPFAVHAYVVGTASGGPLGSPAVVRGLVTLQSAHDEDPYAFPWSFELECDAPDVCAFFGTIRSDGTMELSEGSLLARAGAATCP